MDDVVWRRMFREIADSLDVDGDVVYKPSVVPWHVFVLEHWCLPEDEQTTSESALSRWLSRHSPVASAVRQQQRRIASRIHAHDADDFAVRARETLRSALGDAMSIVQELVLDGDVDTAQYQIERNKSRYESNYSLVDEKSILVLAVLSRSSRMLQMLLDEGADVRQRDVLSAQQALHFAVFLGYPYPSLSTYEFHRSFELVKTIVSSRDMIRLLVARGADVLARDNYFGSALDYARMLDYVPLGADRYRNVVNFYYFTRIVYFVFLVSRLE